MRPHPGGVLTLDDHRHAWFPGIPSAMHPFLRARDFRIALTAESKAYLCRDEDHPGWYGWLEELLGGGVEVEWSHHYGARTGGISYVHRPDVLDRPVLLAFGRNDVLPLGQSTVDRRTGGITVRPVVRDLPPSCPASPAPP